MSNMEEQCVEMLKKAQLLYENELYSSAKTVVSI